MYIFALTTLLLLGLLPLFSRGQYVETQTILFGQGVTDSMSGFGSVMARDSNYIVVGVPTEDQARVYASTSSAMVGYAPQYEFMQTLTDLVKDAPSSTATYFGQSLSMSNGILASGAYATSSVYVYSATTSGGTTTFSCQQVLTSNVTASFGFSTSMYQNTLAVGGHQALSVQVFTKNSNSSTTFSHLQSIPCPGGANCLASYAFGYSLALGSKCLVVGTPGAQLVNVFTITSTSGGLYVLSESLYGENIVSDFFGFSLSLADGKALAVGAYADSHVYVYSVTSDHVFSQQQVLFSPQVGGVGFGYSVSFSGDAMALVVGQFVVENGQSGQAIVFTSPVSPSTSTLQLSYTQSQDISAALSVCYPGAFGAAIVADPVGHEDFAVGSPKINTINLFTSSMPSSQPTGQPTGSPFPPLPTSHPTAVPSRHVTHKPTKAPALPSSASGASSSSSGALSDGGIAGIVILVLFLVFALCAQTYYYNYVYINDEHLLSSTSSTAPASAAADPPTAGGGVGNAADANGIELGTAVATTTTPQKQQRPSMFSFSTSPSPSPSPRRGTQVQSPAALRRGTGIGGFEIDYRSMLLRFLDCFSPEEIANIDTILSGFRTREEDLLDDLYALYGTHPRMFTIRAMVKRYHAIKPLKDANGVAPKFDEMLNAFRGKDEVLLVFIRENFCVTLGDLFGILVSDRVPPPSSLTERSM